MLLGSDIYCLAWGWVHKWQSAWPPQPCPLLTCCWWRRMSQGGCSHHCQSLGSECRLKVCTPPQLCERYAALKLFLFPLSSFEIANLKDRWSCFFYVTKKKRCFLFSWVRKICFQPTPNPDSPPDNYWHLSRAAFNWANIWKEQNLYVTGLGKECHLKFIAEALP